jgi:hypothetical protein
MDDELAGLSVRQKAVQMAVLMAASSGNWLAALTAGLKGNETAEMWVAKLVT